MLSKIIRYFLRLIRKGFYNLLFKLSILFEKNIETCEVNIDGFVIIKKSSKGKLSIGRNFTLNSRKGSNLVGVTNRASFQILEEGRIEIGDNCGFTSTVLSSRKLIKIGDNVLIGGNARIFDHDYHSLNHVHRRDSKLDAQNVRSSEVIIEDDVFIGTNSIILKGVTIGARSIIGAGSVVSLKSIPPDSIVAGNPARIIKSNHHH